MTAPGRWTRGGGLDFTCTRCGLCCRGPGEVWFTQEEKAQALAAISGTPLADKAGSIWRPSGADEVIDVPADQACPLLGPEGCTIQAVKPAQCRTYPFWPELLQSRGAWESEKGRCEGIDLGPNHYAYADIFELLSGRKDTRENS